MKTASSAALKAGFRFGQLLFWLAAFAVVCVCGAMLFDLVLVLLSAVQ